MNESTEDTTTVDTVIYVTPQPTAKEQAVTALVGIGVTIGAYALVVGGVALFGAVSEKVAERRAHKAAAKEAKLHTAEDQK